VTLGKNGSFLATKALGVTFVPTYKPGRPAHCFPIAASWTIVSVSPHTRARGGAERVQDETGCGDTYLACTISELLHLRRRQHRKIPLHSSEGSLPALDDWGHEVLQATHTHTHTQHGRKTADGPLLGGMTSNPLSTYRS
jgi:sugar/nucleoside kinase (ribokinase family)